jgi:hypothetical protein
VLVQVTVRSELLGEFEAVLLHNARESLAKDPAVYGLTSVNTPMTRRGG